MWTILLIFAALFLAYAIYSHYSAQPTDQSRAMRVWGSVVAAVGSLGAYVWSFFQSP